MWLLTEQVPRSVCTFNATFHVRSHLECATDFSIKIIRPLPSDWCVPNTKKSPVPGPPLEVQHDLKILRKRRDPGTLETPYLVVQVRICFLQTRRRDAMSSLLPKPTNSNQERAHRTRHVVRSNNSDFLKNNLSVGYDYGALTIINVRWTCCFWRSFDHSQATSLRVVRMYCIYQMGRNVVSHHVTRVKYFVFCLWRQALRCEWLMHELY